MNLYIDKDIKNLYIKLKEVLNVNINKNYLEVSNDLVNNNKLKIAGYEEIDLNNNLDWENIEAGRSYLRRLNGHIFLGDLIKTYKETNKISYIKKGIEIINNWMNKYELEYELKNKNKYAFHDETTALRLNNWIGFLLVAYEIFSNEELNRFQINIQKTAKLLSDDDFHNKNTNHGMYQDLSLLLYSIVFNKSLNSEIYKEISIKRLKEYFDFVYTKDGVHKEHTPMYHYEVTKCIFLYSNILKDIEPEFSNYLNDLYIKTLQFSYQILKPDGTFPEIGDNAPSKVISKYKELYNDEKYLYSITCGKQGIKPNEDSIVFKEAGYAIFRDDWSKKENSLYILFSAAYNSRYHKHCDELSVLIYKGENLFVESGCNGFEYSDIFTQYGYSSYAHNSLVVDNKSMKLDMNLAKNLEKLSDASLNYEDVYIKDYEIKENYSYVLGINKRYKDIVHKRSISYEKNKNIIRIIDDIDSKNKHNYKILWNLAVGINLKYKDDKIYLVKEETQQNIGEIRFKSCEKIIINNYFGEIENIPKGWYFPKAKEKEKRHTIELECESTSVKFETNIILYDELDNDKYKLNYNEKNIIFNPSKDFNIKENCRVAIYDLKSEKYYKTLYIESNESLVFDDQGVLINPWDYKYKFQVKKGEKYINCTTFLYFVDIDKFKDVFSGRSENISDIESFLTSNITNLPREYKKILRSTLPHLMDNCIIPLEKEIPNTINYFINNVIQRYNNVDCYIVNLCFYLKYTITIKEVFKKHKVSCNYFEFISNKEKYKDLILELKNLIFECEKSLVDLPFASSLIAGRIYDILGEREKAYEKFKCTIEFDKEYLAYMYYESTIYTYINKIDKFPILNNEIKFLNTRKIQEDLTILVSVDEKFFRAYGANLLRLCNVLDGIHFHLHIIGDFQNVKVLVDESLKVYSSMNKISERNNNRPTFSTEEIPKYVTDRVTFYACSRYINARYFMDEFNTDIFIMDADAIFDNIPYKHFQECSNHDVCISIKDFVIATQGRRNAAGLVYIKNNDNGRKYLSLVKNYNLTCFKIPQNLWVLDQNALEYANWYNINNNLGIDICTYDKMINHRCVYQNNFRVVLERYNYNF